MTTSTLLLSSALAPLLAALLASGPPAAPAKLQFTLQTVHAAALTKARAADDAKDEPYLLLSVAGPGTAIAAMPFPAGEPMSIKFDQALPARALHTLSLEDGESVRVVLSALEGPRSSAVMESEAATMAAGIVRLASDKRADALAFALKPLTDKGTNMLGAAILLVTNEGGTLYWRALECVVTCSVLTEPSAAALQGNATNQGVLELTGAGGTYHFNLIGRRVP